MLRGLAGSWCNYHQVRDRALFRREIESVRYAAQCLEAPHAPVPLDVAAQGKLTASLQRLDKAARTRRRNWRSFCSGAEGQAVFGVTEAVSLVFLMKFRFPSCNFLQKD